MSNAARFHVRHVSAYPQPNIKTRDTLVQAIRAAADHLQRNPHLRVLAIVRRFRAGDSTGTWVASVFLPPKFGRVVCCDCGMDLGECVGLAAGKTSHSYCPDCLARARQEIADMRAERAGAVRPPQ